jgi:hypothetical protein
VTLARRTLLGLSIMWRQATTILQPQWQRQLDDFNVQALYSRYMT